jgi:hypothetical protein
MKKIKSVIYDIGGYDETKENNNVVEVVYYTPSELAQLKEQEEAAGAKAALLEKLGITEEEAKLLLS